MKEGKGQEGGRHIPPPTWPFCLPHLLPPAKPQVVQYKTTFLNFPSFFLYFFLPYFSLFLVCRSGVGSHKRKTERRITAARGTSVTCKKRII